MGFVPPPPPISRREFDRRYAQGARTLRELDPAFWAWHTGRQREHLIQAVVLSIGGVMLLVMVVVMVLTRLL